MRPKSIQLFERLFLASCALTLIAQVLDWERSMAAASRIAFAQIGPVFPVVRAVVSIGILILLWYFTARRGSVIAKWATVALTAVSAAAMVWAVAASGVPTRLAASLDLFGLVVRVVAVAYLFHSDSRAWFARPAAPPSTD